MTDGERIEIFRGHFDECREHFRQNFLLPFDRKERAKRQEQIANFCLVTPQTVRRWFELGLVPIGTPLLKFQCLLSAIGFHIIEWERTSATLKSFAELIGFGLMTAKEATSLLGFVAPTSLYFVISEKEGVSEAKRQLMWEAWKSRRSELDQAKRECRKKYCEFFFPTESSEELRLAIPKGQSATFYVMKALMTLLDRQPIEELLASEVELNEQPELASDLIARLKVLDSHIRTQKKGGG